LKLQVFKLIGLVAAGIFAAQHCAHATEKSIRGLKLGMSAHQAMQSLSPALKDGVEIVLINDPSTQRYQLNSRQLRCQRAELNGQVGCVALLAFGLGVPEKGTLFHIQLEQFFDHPLEFAAFEQRIKETYGEPSAFIAGSAWRTFDYSQIHWLWSDDAFALTSEAREWASSAHFHPANVSEPGRKFSSPVLHLSAHVSYG
jgi:hypothetical protein